MFYVVSRWKSYVFVYDTDDSSCEMVEFKRLDQSGIKYKFITQNKPDISKLRTLYNFNKIANSIFSKVIVTYKIPLKGHESWSDIYVNLSVVLIPDSDDILYLSINNSKGSDNYNPVILNTCISNENSSIRVTGIPIPECMFNYLLRLRENHDLHGILSAFDGLLWNKLFVSGNFSCADSSACQYEDWGVN